MYLVYSWHLLWHSRCSQWDPPPAGSGSSVNQHPFPTLEEVILGPSYYFLTDVTPEQPLTSDPIERTVFLFSLDDMLVNHRWPPVLSTCPALLLELVGDWNRPSLRCSSGPSRNHALHARLCDKPIKHLRRTLKQTCSTHLCSWACWDRLCLKCLARFLALGTS